MVGSKNRLTLSYLNSNLLVSPMYIISIYNKEFSNPRHTHTPLHNTNLIQTNKKFKLSVTTSSRFLFMLSNVDCQEDKTCNILESTGRVSSRVIYKHFMQSSILTYFSKQPPYTFFLTRNYLLTLKLSISLPSQGRSGFFLV